MDLTRGANAVARWQQASLAADSTRTARKKRASGLGKALLTQAKNGIV